MEEIDIAIKGLVDEIESFGQGTPSQPRDRPAPEANWFRLRALTLGLSYLRRIKHLSIASNAAGSERLYRQVNRTFKEVILEDPLPEPKQENTPAKDSVENAKAAAEALA